MGGPTNVERGETGKMGKMGKMGAGKRWGRGGEDRVEVRIKRHREMGMIRSTHSL